MDYVCRYNEERIWLIFIGEVYFLGERYNVLIKFIKNYYELFWGNVERGYDYVNVIL